MTSGYAVVAYNWSIHHSRKDTNPHVAYVRDITALQVGSTFSIRLGDQGYTLPVKVLSPPTTDVWEARADLLCITGAYRTRAAAQAFLAETRGLVNG